MAEIRFGQFENQAQSDAEQFASVLNDIGTAIQSGQITEALINDLDLNATRLGNLLSLADDLQTIDTLTQIYSRSLEGDFEAAGISSAEFLVEQIAGSAFAQEFIDFLNPQVLQQAGIDPVVTRGLAELAADATVQTLLESADQTFNSLLQLGETAIATASGSTLAVEGYRSQQPLINRLIEYQNTSIDSPEYDALLFNTAFLSRTFARQAIDTEGSNLFSFLGGTDRVNEEIESGFSLNGQRAIINLDALRDVGLTFQDSFGGMDPLLDYVQSFVDRQLVSIEEYNSDAVLGLYDFYTEAASSLVIGELTSGFRRVTTNDVASVFVLAPGDEGRGSSEADYMLGGSDLRGRGGDDLLSADGQSGGATIIGGAGNDIILGTDNDDPELSGGADNDEIFGFGGVDNITGGGGRDNLIGGAGDDIIDGGGGQDSISGGDDHDTLDGGGGRDTVSGGAGDDTIILSAGADIVSGGRDYDTLDASASTEGINVDLDGGTSSDPDATTNGQQISGIEKFIGSAQNDVIVGWSPGNGDLFDKDGLVEEGHVFIGAGGADSLTVGAGLFTFDGGAGGDTLFINNAVYPGNSTVNLVNADATDMAFIDGANVAVTITEELVDPFEAWVSFTNDDGQEDWEFIYFDDTTSTNYRYVVSTGEMTVGTSGDTIIIKDFADGDLGISVPDNPIGPGVGGAPSQQQNLTPNNFELPSQDLVMVGGLENPVQTDFPEGLLFMEDNQIQITDQWAEIA